MPLNLLKSYFQLLEIISLSERERKESLWRVFRRDIYDNDYFFFMSKPIKPIKKEGEDSMHILYTHLTTKEDKDNKGKKLGTRSFEMDRSIRIHWIKYHIEQKGKSSVHVFSYEDRISGKDIVRTYIYDSQQEYVIILEPQKNGLYYYFLTAYYLNEPGGKKQIENKLRKKLHYIA